MHYFISVVTLISFLSLALTGCLPSPPPRGYDVSKNEASLAEASYAVSRSIVDLAQTSQAAHPLPELAPPPPPASYGMGELTSVDWSGPIAPLVRQIANASNYHLKIIGTAPAIPVIVTVYQKNALLGDVLRDIGFQAGERATIAIYPKDKIIELRYAKN